MSWDVIDANAFDAGRLDVGIEYNWTRRDLQGGSAASGTAGAGNGIENRILGQTTVRIRYKTKSRLKPGRSLSSIFGMFPYLFDLGRVGTRMVHIPSVEDRICFVESAALKRCCRYVLKTWVIHTKE